MTAGGGSKSLEKHKHEQHMKTATSNKKIEIAAGATATTSNSKNPAGQSKIEEITTISPGPAADKWEVPKPLGGTTVYLPVIDLTPHPLNTTIYGNAVDEEFKKAIQLNGIYDPLVIAPKTNDSDLHLIISGHRRWEAARSVGIKEVPVVIFASSDDEAIKLALLESNRQRIKSNEQLVKEYRVYLEIEEKKAAKRQATSVAGQGRQKVAEGESGKATDRAAALVGLSGLTAEKGRKVLVEIEKKIAMKHLKKAEEIRLALLKSVNSAHNMIEPKNKTKPKADTLPPSVEKTPQPETTPNEAIQGVNVAVNYLRSQDMSTLSEEEKAAWKKVAEQLVGLLQEAGIEIEEAIAA